MRYFSLLLPISLIAAQTAHADPVASQIQPIAVYPNTAQTIKINEARRMEPKSLQSLGPAESIGSVKRINRIDSFKPFEDIKPIGAFEPIQPFSSAKPNEAPMRSEARPSTSIDKATKTEGETGNTK